RPPVVVVAEAAWKPGGPLERRVKRAGLRAFDGPHVRYCVLASAERERFAATWGVPVRRVAFTPYATTWTPEELTPAGPGDGSVFAGGDAMRDHGPLLAAAPEVAADVTIASRRLAPVRRGRLTVTALPHDAYVARLRAASVVVVALASGTARSAGQQTYLGAMATGRVVVVPDVLGVRDYVTDGVDGLIVPPDDPRALAAALRWALDPAHAAEVAAMGARA
ncbi:glycosyltransferase, partial [Patulibacter sp. S7RM1-6]